MVIHYLISLQSSVLPLGSLVELLIPISAYILQAPICFLKLLKDYLSKGRGEKVKFVCDPGICFALRPFGNTIGEC